MPCKIYFDTAAPKIAKEYVSPMLQTEMKITLFSTKNICFVITNFNQPKT
jgi:hypothetical protein